MPPAQQLMDRQDLHHLPLGISLAQTWGCRQQRDMELAQQSRFWEEQAVGLGLSHPWSPPQAAGWQLGWINCLVQVPHPVLPLPVTWCQHPPFQRVMEQDPSQLQPLALTACPQPLQTVKLAQSSLWCRGLRAQGMWHRQEIQRVKVPMWRQVLQPSALSRIPITLESCQLEEQEL